MGAEGAQRADVFARPTTTVDDALSTQWARDPLDPIDSFSQIERSARITTGRSDLEIGHLSRVIKLEVSLRPPPLP